ncbi:MAG: FHA domain-containing protein [Candidatus Omnitrophica bacterium]|nr:FHA domain-containing protein [Candidatus Omnitrophota bacterium]
MTGEFSLIAFFVGTNRDRTVSFLTATSQILVKNRKDRKERVAKNRYHDMLFNNLYKPTIMRKFLFIILSHFMVFGLLCLSTTQKQATAGLCSDTLSPQITIADEHFQEKVSQIPGHELSFILDGITEIDVPGGTYRIRINESGVPVLEKRSNGQDMFKELAPINFKERISVSPTAVYHFLPSASKSDFDTHNIYFHFMVDNTVQGMSLSIIQEQPLIIRKPEIIRLSEHNGEKLLSQALTSSLAGNFGQSAGTMFIVHTSAIIDPAGNFVHFGPAHGIPPVAEGLKNKTYNEIRIIVNDSGIYTKNNPRFLPIQDPFQQLSLLIKSILTESIRYANERMLTPLHYHEPVEVSTAPREFTDTDEIFIFAGAFSYRVWTTGSWIYYQQHDKSGTVPRENKPRSLKKGEELIIGRAPATVNGKESSTTTYKINDSELSRVHCSVSVTWRNGLPVFTVRDIGTDGNGTTNKTYVRRSTWELPPEHATITAAIVAYKTGRERNGKDAIAASL